MRASVPPTVPKLRDEFLNETFFTNITEARQIIEVGKQSRPRRLSVRTSRS
jgi:hypothetical protein